MNFSKYYSIVLVFFLASMSLMAQKKVNDYKYVIVANQYDFVKGEDQYQLNSLTKFLFNKHGYDSYLVKDEYPKDLELNGCLAMNVRVNKIKGGFLKTQLQIELFDCKGEIILVSRIGMSRVKDFGKAYNLALRDAFVSFQNLGYKYKPNAAILSQGITVSDDSNKEAAVKAKEEIERLQNEIKVLKEEKVVKTAIVVTPVVVPEITEKAKKNAVEKVEKTEILEVKKETIQTLYAQPIDNGFQLVDTTPKKIMVLYYSGSPNVFIVKGKDAIVYKKKGLWIMAENDGKTLKSEAINIKF